MVAILGNNGLCKNSTNANGTYEWIWPDIAGAEY